MNSISEEEMNEILYGKGWVEVVMPSRGKGSTIITTNCEANINQNQLRKEAHMPTSTQGFSYQDLFFTPVKTRNKTVETQIKKVIYHNPATIVYWEDGTKTVVKAMEGDTFDPERGLLQAYFEKNSGLSRTQSNKFIKKVVKENYTDKLEV